MIHCLTIAPLRESDKVLVYSNDTDVFTLLLKHHHEFNSKNIFRKGSGSPINVSYVFSVLGEEICGSLLSLHAITGTRDPLDYGWEINNGKIVPVTTDIEIAPKAIIELVACNCGGECSNLRCKCKKNNVSCTDFCGCNEMCENVDVKISDYTTEELTEDDSTRAEID